MCDQQNCLPDGHKPMVAARRICLFGGPGSGKSTSAHYLMYIMKSIGLDVEYCREWIKRWAYAKRPMDRLLDQIVVMGRQIEEECEAVATGCIVVTDSPILLQAAYAEHPQDVARAIMIEQGLQAKYPTLNIFLDRGGRHYNQHGRWENAGIAGARDAAILSLLQDAKLPFTRVVSGDFPALWKVVTSFSPGAQAR